MTNLTSSIQVSEEMIEAGHEAYTAWQQNSEPTNQSLGEAIYLAMRSKDHSIAVDDVRKGASGPSLSDVEAMLFAQNVDLIKDVERLRALIRKADEIAGESLSGCHDTAFYGEWCGEVVFSDPSLDRQGK